MTSMRAALKATANDLHELIAQLGLGPVHVAAQDIGGGPFTSATMSNAAAKEITSISLEGVGHYAAQEAPDQVSQAILNFVDRVDSA